MDAPGITGTVRLAAVLALAAPLLFFGADFMLRGRGLIGGGFVAIGLLILLTQWRLTNPLDPGDIVEAAVDRVVRDREE